ncbi:MAG: VPLPA-CTERM sorting domain-containing protein [Pseudomonadota bacterium]
MQRSARTQWLCAIALIAMSGTASAAKMQVDIAGQSFSADFLTRAILRGDLPVAGMGNLPTLDMERGSVGKTVSGVLSGDDWSYNFEMDYGDIVNSDDGEVVFNGDFSELDIEFGLPPVEDEPAARISRGTKSTGGGGGGPTTSDLTGDGDGSGGGGSPVPLPAAIWFLLSAIGASVLVRRRG